MQNKNTKNYKIQNYEINNFSYVYLINIIIKY